MASKLSATVATLVIMNLFRMSETQTSSKSFYLDLTELLKFWIN